jgi:K+-transporting ATPase ATPase A chain
MTVAGWLQIAIFTVIVGLLARPLGGYLTRVYAGERTPISAAAKAHRNSTLPSCRSKAGS